MTPIELYGWQTLIVAYVWSLYLRVHRDGAWPQRWPPR